MHVGLRARGLAALASAVTAIMLIISPAMAAAPTVSVVADHLNSPRGIDVAVNGRVFFTEVGTGQPNTGRIGVIRKGEVSTYAGGLPSTAVTTGDGVELSGPTNVATWSDGHPTVTIGAGDQTADSRFNSVLRAHTGRVLADVQAWVNAHPDPNDLEKNPTDSNPYGITALSRDQLLVTDAADNSLFLVRPGQGVELIARFPTALISTAGIPGFPGPAMVPAEAVPTTVAVGPDGYWYVGELKGFPFAAGASRIWRISPSARGVTCDPTATHGPCTLFMDGFTSITGLDFGRDGTLYVVEIAKNGVPTIGHGTGGLFQVKHGVKTELVPGQLSAPGDVAVARDGTVYVTNWSVAPGIGQVLAIRP